MNLRNTMTKLKTRQQYLIAFFIVLLFYLLSFPENRHENDDGYRYAHLVKEGSVQHLARPKFVLYLPLMKVLYTIADMLSPFTLDTYTFLCFVSSAAASLSLILLFITLYKQLKLSLTVSILGACLFLFAYDQWRYAVEADVYALSNLLIICILYSFLRLKNSGKEIQSRDTILVGIMAGFAVLIYKPNFIPVFICMPLLLHYKKNTFPIISYMITGGLVILPSYFLAYKYLQIDVNDFSYFIFSGMDKVQGSMKMIFFLLPTKIISANFIFGIDFVLDTINRQFPAHILEEEVYAARQNGVLNYIALCSAGITLLLSVGLCIRNVKNIKINTLHPLIWIALFWFLIYGISLAFMDPNSPEPWSMTILPMVLIITLLLFDPYVKKYNYRLPGILLLLIFVHNTVGGFTIVRSLEGNLTHYKSIWVIDNAKQDDLVLTLGSSNLMGYIAYHTGAQVKYFDVMDTTCIQTAIEKIQQGHKVYFTEEVLSPSPSIKYRNPEGYLQVLQFLERNREQFRCVNSGSETGKIYEFTGKLGPHSAVVLSNSMAH